MLRIIMNNDNIQDDTPLGRLMHDFCCKNPDDMHYKELAEKTRYFKEKKQTWITAMISMNLAVIFLLLN